MGWDIAGRTREGVVPPGPAEAVGTVEDREIVTTGGKFDAHRDAPGARADDADSHPHCEK